MFHTKVWFLKLKISQREREIISLHKKLSFLLKIVSVNVIKYTQFLADLVTFTEEILDGKVLRSVLNDDLINIMNSVITWIVHMWLKHAYDKRLQDLITFYAYFLWSLCLNTLPKIFAVKKVLIINMLNDKF